MTGNIMQYAPNQQASPVHIPVNQQNLYILQLAENDLQSLKRTLGDYFPYNFCLYNNIMQLSFSVDKKNNISIKLLSPSSCS